MSAPPRNAVECAIAARHLLDAASQMAPDQAEGLREVIAWLNALMGLDGEGR